MSVKGERLLFRGTTASQNEMVGLVVQSCEHTNIHRRGHLEQVSFRRASCIPGKPFLKATLSGGSGACPLGAAPWHEHGAPVRPSRRMTAYGVAAKKQNSKNTQSQSHETHIFPEIIKSFWREHRALRSPQVPASFLTDDFLSFLAAVWIVCFVGGEK